MSETPELTQLTETDPMTREVNHGLMVHWINAKLIDRAHHDVRNSIVIYDSAKTFVAALAKMPDEALTKKLFNAGIRYWSKGIV